MGTLLHFLYDWTGKSVLVAPFSAINESTWEHMKLMFVPAFIFALIQSAFFKDAVNYWCVKFIGIMTGVILIPVIFYTYNGAFGKSPDYVNIAIFFIAATAVYILETRLYKKGVPRCKKRWLPILILCTVAALFILFSFFTPSLPLFIPPN